MYSDDPIIPFILRPGNQAMNIKKVARCCLPTNMALDQNEKKLIEKLTSALNLLNASEKDHQVIPGAKRTIHLSLKRREIFLTTLTHAMSALMLFKAGEIPWMTKRC